MNLSRLRNNNEGFTLLELLIVIVIIAILAAIVFVALDPATRFQDARDARRASDVVELLHAIKLDQVDNGGDYATDIEALTSAEIYMIGTATTGCDDDAANCDTDPTSDTHCVDLAELVTDGYLGEVPISPAGAVTWDATTTGYTLRVNGNGTARLSSCESENTTEITFVR